MIISPSNFTFMESCLLFVIVLLGGLGSISGVTLAAAEEDCALTLLAIDALLRERKVLHVVTRQSVDHVREYFYLHQQVSDPMLIGATSPALFYLEVQPRLSVLQTKPERVLFRAALGWEIAKGLSLWGGVGAGRKPVMLGGEHSITLGAVRAARPAPPSGSPDCTGDALPAGYRAVAWR